jgi:hypothetical protein
MLSAVRELQIPVLAAMLLGGCAAKAWQAWRSHSISAVMGATGLFPLRLRRPVMITIFVTEFGLGLGLVATGGQAGTDLPAASVRTATAIFFLIAVGALQEARQRRPEVGCGCFGELSETPIGRRTVVRSGLLCVCALGTIGAPQLRMPDSSTQAELWLAVLAAEVAVMAFLSPEIGEILVRLGYSEPCELRRLPVGRTMAALHTSSQWRRYASQVTAATPVDVWREGCWRFVVYPGLTRGRRVDIVFAVYLQARRPPIRAVVLDPATNEVLARPEPASLPLSRSF